MRFAFIPPLLIALLSPLQGCATQDRAARAAEETAIAESEDDEICQKKGPPGSEAYTACRDERADARAKAAAVQEQKRRDFDRVLGAGTEAQSGL
ncbi:MAG TPA: hypothetical protein VNJ31_04960 [Methyloceanibacter sp.]|nr:hypothetical protein [Methyloceanibacter sp.]